VSDEVDLMVDYNQALLRAEALVRGRALEAEGVLWFEEPIRHDDLAGQTAIAEALDLPLQIGENFNGSQALSVTLYAGACDNVMPDVASIGGVTGWIQAAAVASAKGVPMSSHLMPEFSVHLLAATPTAHFLEYVDGGNSVLEQPHLLRNGAVEVRDRPGSGLEWDEDKIKRLDAV
jgi:mandelate racemase